MSDRWSRLGSELLDGDEQRPVRENKKLPIADVLNLDPAGINLETGSGSGFPWVPPSGSGY
jgi:hypothetical protein